MGTAAQPSSGISDTTIAVTADTASTDPTDRSMPPVRMTTVMPVASTMLIDACRTMFSRLFSVRKLGAMNEKMMAITIRTGRMPAV